MIAASGLLFYEGARVDTARMVGGAVLGALFVALASRLLAARKDVRFEALALAGFVWAIATEQPLRRA